MSSPITGPHGRSARPSLTPGVIRFTRRLSVDGEPLVEPGQWVSEDTPLLAMHTFPGRVLRNQVASDLRVNPADTEDCLIAAPGQMLAVGDIVARSSMFWQHRVARTNYEGSVAGVSPSLGVVYMREHIPTQIAETVRISVIEELQGDKNLFSSYVKVKEGDKVEKGQVIATREEGHNYTNIFSPVFGTIVNVAPLLGALSIVPDRVSSVVLAHVPGRVLAIRDNREVDLAGYGVIFEGLIGIGGETSGRLTTAGNSPAAWRPAGDADLTGKVVVTGHVDDTSLRLAAQQGAVAVIAGRAHEAALCRFANKELGVIATGDEDIPLVVVLTEGFGAGAISPRTYELLDSFAGQTVSVSGTTHIRAGVIRPRIVVSLPPPDQLRETVEAPARGQTELAADSAPATVGLLETPTELAVGLRARILRGPHAGRSGHIVDLPVRAQQVATGASVLVAVVQLDAATADIASGVRQVIVPQANLKLEGGTGIDG